MATPALWRQARARGFLGFDAKKRWTVTADDRLCPICAPMQGIEVPLDAAFPGGVQGPPRHPQCRCALVLVTGARTQQQRSAA